MLLGQLGTLLFVLLFGFSGSFGWALVREIGFARILIRALVQGCRFAWGLVNGNIGVTFHI